MPIKLSEDTMGKPTLKEHAEVIRGIVEKWPGWKRNVKVTKHSMR